MRLWTLTECEGWAVNIERSRQLSMSLARNMEHDTGRHAPRLVADETGGDDVGEQCHHGRHKTEKVPEK